MPSTIYTGPILSPEQTLILLGLAGACVIAGILIAEGRVLRVWRSALEPKPEAHLPQERAVLP